jgi:hypothetical protein
MFERLRTLHDAGRLTHAQIEGAVTRGWITPEQAAEIVGGADG